MPLLPKRSKARAAAAALAPSWHPNFRNFERLPDTKTVRTSFFINGAAITITLGLLLYTVYGEYELRNLANDTAGYEASIAKEKDASTAAVTQFKKFQAEEKTLRELDQFDAGGLGGGKLVVSEYLLHLSTTLPPKIALTHFEARASGVILNGAVLATPDEGAGLVDAFVQQLQDDQAYGPLFDSVEANNETPETATGRYTFEIVLNFKPAAPKEDKDKDKEAAK
jgi:hypothetical protein